MKNLILIFLLSLAFSATSQAQRFAFVDSEKILSEMTEYKAAQDALDELTRKWKDDIAREYEIVKKMYQKFQAEEVLLTDQQKKEREQSIIEKEQKIRQVQKDKFGPEGELFAKQNELIKPIQEKVYDAILKYAEEKNLDIIFDKANGANILYGSDKYDKTAELLLRIN